MDFTEEEEMCSLLPPLEKIYSIDDVHSTATVSEPGWFSTFLSTMHSEVDSKKVHELVVDYLICEGYREAAELLCVDADMKFPKEDVENLDRRNAIRNSIVNGDIALALEQINDVVPDLLKNNIKLNFQLIRQQLVEVIRNKEIEKALQFAQDHLSNMSEMPPELLAKLEQTYGLLAFEHPESSPFGHLMDLNQRHMLATEVNSAILAVFNKNPTSKLENLIRLMVWNQHQILTRGEVLKPASLEVTTTICKDLFGDQMVDNRKD
uniref:CTLH domain-containing protein n=1 Tax=Acrobeloides nanus TaxID=290746 RepID=A0A914EI91_9BILA